MLNILDLFEQVIMESGTVLTCYDAVGPTHPSYYMAKYACNYTDEMWNSGNFGPLKDCLMKIDVQDGIDFQMVKELGFGFWQKISVFGTGHHSRDQTRNRTLQILVLESVEQLR